MRNIAETDLSLIPEEIAIQDVEVMHLVAAVPDFNKAITIAYAAGAQAMEKLDEKLNDDEALRCSEHVYEAAESISKSIKLLRSACDADYLPILEQIIDLVSDTIERANSDLCNYFGIEIDLL